MIKKPTNHLTLFLLILIFSTGSLAGCDSLSSKSTADLKATTHEQVDDFPGLTMTAVDDSIKASEITLLFENQSRSHIVFSDDFFLEEKIDGVWYEVPVIINGVYSFDGLAYEVLPSKESECKVEWEWLYGNLKPGNYRILKSVQALTCSQGSYVYYLTAEFEI